MLNHFTGDPYWTTATKPENCISCHGRIPAGQRIYFFPKGPALYCRTCGIDAYDQFLEQARAEYEVTGPLEDDPDVEDYSDWGNER